MLSKKFVNHHINGFYATMRTINQKQMSLHIPQLIRITQTTAYKPEREMILSKAGREPLKPIQRWIRKQHSSEAAALRRALKQLSAPPEADVQGAEQVLAQHLSDKLPVVMETVCRSLQRDGMAAVRIALRMQSSGHPAASGLLARLTHETSLHSTPAGEMLRPALQQNRETDSLKRQACAALHALEQRPENHRAIVRFKQASETLSFLLQPLPQDILHRALAVRITGGEDLGMVRSLINNTLAWHMEHISMVRVTAGRCLLQMWPGEAGIAALGGMLAHPSPAVQLTAIFSLQNVHEPSLLRPLHALTCSPDAPVREEAAALISRMGMPYADPLILVRPSTILNTHETLLRSKLSCTEEAPSLLRSVQPMNKKLPPFQKKAGIQKASGRAEPKE